MRGKRTRNEVVYGKRGGGGGHVTEMRHKPQPASSLVPSRQQQDRHVRGNNARLHASSREAARPQAEAGRARRSHRLNRQTAAR